MGTNREHLDLLKRMIVDHRNHPSVALWSIGNEEWWIEGNEKGEKIALIGFGTFSVLSRKARTGHNPATGKSIKIPAKKVVKFKPGSAFAKMK